MEVDGKGAIREAPGKRIQTRARKASNNKCSKETAKCSKNAINKMVHGSYKSANKISYVNINCKIKVGAGLGLRVGDSYLADKDRYQRFD